MPIRRIIFLTLYLLKMGPAYSTTRLGLGDKCKTSRDCQSQHCVTVCSGKESVCIQPDWFYIRHGLQVPNCIEHDRIRVNLPHAHKRMVGQTCHNDRNCYSNKCIPLCGSNKHVWICAESTSHYEEKKIKTPTCLEIKEIALENDEDKEKEEVKEEKDSPLRKLGESCLNDMSCLSGNCCPTCNASDSESLCNEPRWLFTAHELPLPHCIDKNNLPKLIHASEYDVKEEFQEVYEFLNSRLDGKMDLTDNVHQESKGEDPNIIDTAEDEENKRNLIKGLERELDKKRENAVELSTTPKEIDDIISSINKDEKEEQLRQLERLEQLRLRRHEEQQRSYPAVVAPFIFCASFIYTIMIKYVL